MILAKDFEDFLRLLNKHQVDFMVVGGYALAFHGKPRNTGDLDIWINVSQENAERILHVVNEFGLATLGFKKKDFLQQGFIHQIGYPPLRIDILNSIDGVDFPEAAGNRQLIKMDDGLVIPFIGLQDLVKNKQASGRAQDLADIKEIKKILPKKQPGKGKRSGR
ncbi:nucleotidyltransferase [Chitinophaga sp. GCM10012297]|uniref:Nucleotidyltransferase n=1 Tax=Chitinophaga chungangae TaxID=2821488 RepID=A0ABS3YJG3_9BACT|nr:nucleotidyltransferase [Chitinophaga chungangae]MBO9154792.1 nucleotidyltransferase [Chitinophaga chungangae]